MNEELNYYKLDDFYRKCMDGSIDIHRQIKLKDRAQTKEYRISFLRHVLYLCKHHNSNLLDILNTLKDKIETFLKRLIRENFYIKSYIQSIISEWSLNLDPEEMFNKINEVFKYEDFMEENKTFNQLMGGMKSLERNIMKKEYNEDTDIRDTLSLLFTNCTDCKDKIKKHIEKLIRITSNIEPTYNYLLIDLSMKHKPNYLEMANESEKNSSIFNRLINTSTDRDIPDNINTIFLNYILLVNLLKKEYHFLITTLKAIDYNLSERHNSLNVMMDGLNIKDVQPVIMDSNIDIDEEDEEENEGFSLF
jgi:hypothetical protein